MKLPGLRLHIVTSGTLEKMQKVAADKARNEQRQYDKTLVSSLLAKNAILIKAIESER